MATTQTTPEIPTPEEAVPGPVQFEYCSGLQEAAVNHPPGTPLLLIGGFNSGKTTAAILHMMMLCETFPGYKVAVLRKTFQDMKLTTRPSFDQWLKPEHVKSTSEKEVVMKNGSSFVFHYLDQPNSATVLRGLEINAAILDQAEQMQDATFNILLGRLGRWKGATVPPHALQKHPGAWPWRESQTNRPIPPVSIILTANPSEDGDPELHWLWQRFSNESKRFHEKYSKQGYRSMTLPTTSNKFAGQQNRLDEMSIIDHDPVLMGNIQNNMNLGRCLDHGDSAPTCCLWYAVDGENNIYVWQEYYQAGITDTGEYSIEDHRTAIAQMSKGHTIRTNLADPSIFAKSRGISGFTKKEQRWSVADEYSDRRIITSKVGGQDTVIFWKPADNNEDLSRMRLRQYLKLDPAHKHPITGEPGAPHIYFIRQGPEWPQGCARTMQEIRGAKRLQVGESDGKPIYGDERDPAIPDHALDCVRYIVNSRPLPASSGTAKQKLKAYAKADGRVILEVPPVTANKPRPRRYIDRGAWKSRGGGY
jgi:hypothetical protein